MPEPVWMTWIKAEAKSGEVKEPFKNNRGPAIRRYVKLAKCGQEGDPYCAIGVNAALEANGIPGTRSALARSFERDRARFVRLTGPALGAIAVFWRGSKASGFGHVGVYVGETEHHVYVLGFNQADDVNESPYPKAGRSFGLVGYFWPIGVEKPVVQPIRLGGDGRPLKSNLKVT